ncbi:MAG: Na+/H+ antiporter NhaC family protein [Planctomycetota bacterium]
MEFGAWSLLPPVAAITLALATKRVVVPMLIGIVSGAILLSADSVSVDTPSGNTATELGQRVASSLWITFDCLWQSMSDGDHIRVLIFSVLLGAMIGVLEAGGCLRRLILAASRKVRSRRGGQTLIASSGLIIFFDDYANTLLVGGTMRSTADRFRISRAKLAYLVDSTAAPVAGLTLISTWVATELSYLDEGLRAAGIDNPGLAVSVFTQSLAYRFYPILAIVMVIAIAIMGRDYGPMRIAELDAQRTIPENDPLDTATIEFRRRDLIASITPIVSVIISVLVVLFWTGRSAVDEVMFDWLTLGQILGSGDSYLALMIAGAVGLIIAFALHVIDRHQTTHREVSARLLVAAARGAFDMMPAMMILWLAWALSSFTTSDALDTGGFLASYLSDRLNVVWLPTCVFVLSGLVAFATGTSWGTMALLTPLSVTLSIDMVMLDAGVMALPELTSGDAQWANQPIVLETFSGVLAGAIFGDHCSPISDTTVLSSRASGCDHITHVRTQMPYALTVASVSVVLGTVPVAWGCPVWLALTLSFMAVVGIVRLVGRPAVSDAATEIDS